VRVLVTGGTGFIGSRLTLRCLERGDDVRVLAQANTPAEEKNHERLKEAGAEILLGSVTERSDAHRAVEKRDVVFHLAATQHEMNVPDERFWEVNVDGTLTMVETSIETGVQRFVHGSTIGVYGAPTGPLDEDSPTNPDNIYGVTKLEGEKKVLEHADRLSVVVIRIPEVYGPGDRRLVKLFRAVAKGKFPLIGSGANLHHLIFVEDLVDAFLLAAETPQAGGEVILLGGPRPVTTDEMVESVARAVESRPPRLHLPMAPFAFLATLMEFTLRPLGIQPPLHRRRLDFFRKSFELSCAKARRVLGFEPKTSFDEGAVQTTSWYREHGIL